MITDSAMSRHESKANKGGYKGFYSSINLTIRRSFYSDFDKYACLGPQYLANLPDSNVSFRA